MTSFKEYLTSIKPSSPDWDGFKLDWEVKGIVVTLGWIMLLAMGISFSVDISPWFLFLLSPIPPMILYMIYCAKKDTKELD